MPMLIAIIPAKQFRAAKQRLTALLMQKERHDLATAMLHDVLHFVNRREFATLLESIKSDTCGADPHRDPCRNTLKVIGWGWFYLSPVLDDF
jgi:hypothetical protein